MVMLPYGGNIQLDVPHKYALYKYPTRLDFRENVAITELSEPLGITRIQVCVFSF
jgi:hypothetical protein